MWALSAGAVVCTALLGRPCDLRTLAPSSPSRSLSGSSPSFPYLEAGSGVCSSGRVMVTIVNQSRLCGCKFVLKLYWQLFIWSYFFSSQWPGVWLVFVFLSGCLDFYFFKFQNSYCKSGLLWVIFHSCHLALSLIFLVCKLRTSVFDFSVNRLKTEWLDT